ncbi:MAG: hypothetical protein F4Y03_01110 [Alphaproteobacteria bacterium]|nr:hypothetical protein [Alphaproteobacteria bacterium]
MIPRTKLQALSAIAVALSLVGCGGGGGGGSVTGTLSKLVREARTAAALTKQAAIETEAGQAVDAGLGGSAGDGSAVATYSLTISRDAGDLTVKVADSAMAQDGDPAFAFTVELGENGRMLVRDNGMGVEEVVGVHSDIEALEAIPFAEVHALDFSTDGTNDAPDVTHEALTIAGNAAEVLGRVMSAAFTAGTVATLRFAHDDPATLGTDEARELAGAYDGAPGTYRCNGAVECTVEIGADGGIAGMSAGWIFTPDPGATVDVRDGDYLHYGFWLRKTTDDEGAVTYGEVETFAGSSVPASGDLTAVMGRATYEGGAAGVYIIKTRYDPDTGKLVNANSGHFAADAHLTAVFGQTVAQDIAPNQLYRLAGTIDNFVLSGNEDNDWSVALAGTIDSGAGTASGTAEGGVTGQDGSFSAVFHSSVAPVDHDDDPQTPNVVPQPHTAVGEFNASFGSGSVAGAFGMRRQ